MARVALLCPDLLFGSKLEGALAAAGHDVARVGTEEAARAAAAASDLLVVDLTAEGVDGTALGGLDLPTLAVYAHVDRETRSRAEQAGFDRVVPRSRMAREGAALVQGLLRR